MALTWQSGSPAAPLLRRAGSISTMAVWPDAWMVTSNGSPPEREAMPRNVLERACRRCVQPLGDRPEHVLLEQAEERQVRKIARLDTDQEPRVAGELEDGKIVPADHQQDAVRLINREDGGLPVACRQIKVDHFGGTDVHNSPLNLKRRKWCQIVRRQWHGRNGGVRSQRFAGLAEQATA